MKIKETLVKGIREVLYNSKLVILFWGTNAALAIILSLPVYYLLIDNLSRSLISSNLTGGFDYIWFIQFKNLYEKNIGEIPYMIYSIVGVYILIQTFYQGGLITIFNNPKKNHIVDFFYGSVKYWYRFAKILIITLIFFTGVFYLTDWLGDLLNSMLQNSERELLDFILRIIRYMIYLFFIGIITIISDYAKVATAVKDSSKILKEILHSLKFVQKNFYKLFFVFLIVAAFGASGAVIYNLLGMWIPRTPYYFLILSFILQQLLIIFRLLIRMLFYSTEVLLYKDLSAAVVPVDPNQVN